MRLLWGVFATALALPTLCCSAEDESTGDEGCGCAASTARGVEISLDGEGVAQPLPDPDTGAPAGRRADPGRLSGHRNEYVLLPGGDFNMGTDKQKILPVSRPLLAPSHLLCKPC